MAITRTTIMNSASAENYRKGQDIFLVSSRIEDYEMDIHPYLQLPCVSATVYDADQTANSVQITIDEDQNAITGCFCSCDDFYQSDKLCKHCVAVLLKYISRRNIDNKGQDVYTSRHEAAGQSMIRSYAMMDMHKTLDEENRGQIHLEPVLHYTYGRMTAEFKVGYNKKYIIKDLVNFAHLVRSGDVFEYGRNLKFRHDRSAFTQDSLPLLDFILDRTEEYEYHFKFNQEQYFAYKVLKPLRELPLPGKCIDSFLTLLSGRHVKLTLDRQITSVIFLDADPKMSLDITVDPRRGFKMALTDYLPIFGEQEMWILQEPYLYHCSPDFTHNMKVFLKNMDDLSDHTLYLPGKQMTAFCGSVLKAISGHLDISHENIDLNTFMPPEVSFAFYIDNPEEDVVTLSAMARYDHDTYSLTDAISYNAGYRDPVKEQQVISMLMEYFARVTPDLPTPVNADYIIFHDEEKIFRFLEQGMNSLYQIGEVFVSDNMKKLRILSSPHAAIGVSVAGDLLELEISSKDLPYGELAGILDSYKRRRKFFKLKNGEYLRLENNSLSVLSELADGLHLKDQDIQEGGRIAVPLFRAAYVDSVLTNHGNDIQINRDKYFKSLIRDLKSVQDSDYEVPPHIKPILRDYQKTGYRWLQTIAHLGFGGILADDMGLGKTLQVITLLSGAKHEYDSQAVSLIVCPSSLVYNWESEIFRFSPEIRSLLVIGNAGERQELLKTWQDYDVLITSYDMLRRDIDLYEDMRFRYQIIDEAQYIKNHNTQSARSVCRIHSVTRFALTGTPIENRLSELWSIFDYLMPDYLYPYSYFRSEIEQPIVEQGDEIAATRLKQLVKPFIMRRLKNDVLKELPDKLENAIYSRLTDEQQHLYDASVLKLQESLGQRSDADFRADKIQVLAELTKLRQICCDPSLVFENYHGGSAKLDTCIQLIENAIAGSHKVLLFSQFTSMLDIIEKRLNDEHISHYRLDGSTRSDVRAQLVRNFNQDDTSVFLISLKAGGTGLNLTGADIVIHYDPWWNVAAQNQATDRAHRIGQTRTVNVYKLIAGHTIEEKILKLQEDKQALSDRIITGEGISVGSLSREDLLKILE